MMMAMMRTEFSDDILLSGILICIVRTCARTHTHRSGNFRRFPSCINISGFAFFIIVCFLALSVCLLGYIFVCFVDLSFSLSIYVCELGNSFVKNVLADMQSLMSLLIKVDELDLCIQM